MIDEFKKDLVNYAPSLVVQKWIIDRTPHIFNEDQKLYVEWKSKLSDKIGVDGRAITLIGSSSVGFSLSPDKNYHDFHDGSDIDVAIISRHHFELAWHTIRNLGAERFSLTKPQKTSLEDHKNRLIYWGAFDTRYLLARLPFGKVWFEAFEKMSLENPTISRDINARIYRDFESLSAYHVNNLNQLRSVELSRK